MTICHFQKSLCIFDRTFPYYFPHICLNFSIMAASVLLFWHWEAMLISYLAIRKIILPFNNVEELITTSDFKITLTEGTSAEQKFKYSTNPIWQIGKSNFSFHFHQSPMCQPPIGWGRFKFIN